ncbi:MAG: 3-dehydroquinate synthase [Kordiimonadaceae bacterium]|jgi:3-dehydroquinate synthase|nr:3-dehydroquinate synthase [Kordiimonadaceae bacterium]MBT6328413.1 3-dehydroquinate synthase [Kordiimonadaceae bacterium]
MTHKITVELGARSYDILIGENILESAADYIGPLLNRPKTVIITDVNVAAHQLSRLETSLAGANIAFESIILGTGEQTKSFEHLQNLLNRLLELRLERSDTIIAMGGGVIGDLVGFGASIYLRGINFIQIPTTLLAQVDSSVGGKTGINTDHGKNLIGAFHQPNLVLIDVTTLETLEMRHIVSGYGEVVKYGLINDEPFFSWLEQNGKLLLSGTTEEKRSARTEAILRSCQAKAAVVADDEHESGARALLNLGHTFGHALEAEVGYNDKLYHGEAVAMGIILAFKLSEKSGLCPPEDVLRVERHFENISAKNINPFNFDVDHLLHHMRGDKKMSSGKLTFVVCRGIAKACLSNDVNMDDVRSVLEEAVRG